MLNILAFIVLAIMGIVDIYLLVKGNRTISGAVHKAFPRSIDLIILVASVAGVWYVLGVRVFTTVMCGVVLGHLFWQSDE